MKIQLRIATQKHRLDLLRNTVTSLLSNQTVHEFRIHIYHNDSDNAINESGVVNLHGPNLFGIAKFIKIDNPCDYVLTCDDDILYPPDYIDRCIEHLSKHPIIAWHGRIYNKYPITHYFNDTATYCHFSQSCPGLYIQFPGTGVMGWDPNRVTIDISDYKTALDSDAWTGLICARRYVQIFCPPKDKNWLIAQIDKQANQSIYAKRKNDCSKRTEIVNLALKEIRTHG